MLSSYKISDVKGGIKFAESPMGGQQLLVFRQLINFISNLNKCNYDHPEFINMVQEFVAFYKGNVQFLMSNENGPFERMVHSLVFTSGFMNSLGDKISSTCSMYTGIYPRKEWFTAFGHGELLNTIENVVAPILLNKSKNIIEIGMECLFQEVLIRDLLPFNGDCSVAKGLHSVLSDWYLHV